jgi:dTMP kinase
MANRRGKFMVIEGNTNGAGKTKQARDLLVPRLIAEGQPALYMRFPRYGNPSAANVERYLNEEFGPVDSIDAWTAANWFLEDQVAAAPEISAALENGIHVIGDRFAPSNMGHQGGKIADREERRRFMLRLDEHQFVTLGVPRPDLSIVLTVPVELGIERVANAGGPKHGHERNEQHLRNAAEAYMDMVALFPGFHVIDCMRDGAQLPPEEIHGLIWDAVQATINVPAQAQG